MTPITAIADLKALPHWVVFGFEPQPDGKKPKKVPFTAGTDRKALPNDPTTWCAHAEAMADATRTDRVPGVALTPAMGLTLIDIDGATDHPLIATLASYTERSVNGGLHILVRGRPPEGFVAPAGVEVYPRTGNRFLILTEDIIAGRDTIEDRTEILASLFPPASASKAPPSTSLTLDDEEILRRARAAKNGGEFATLFDRGDTSAYANDDSRADLALCSMIAFWTQSPEQIDRLFRQSSLHRAKWERRSDYRDPTIARALQRSAFYTPPVAPDIRVAPPTSQDDPSGADPCADVRDELAALRAENAALKTENVALRAERDQLSRLQSATMTMFRSRDFHAGEKIIGLVSLFEAEAATTRGATDPEGWTDTPLDRIAESAGCSAKVAGKHQATISTTGIIESRTIDRRDPDTGVVTKRRQIRVPAPTPDIPAPSLPERIIALSTATPERDPEKKRWGGFRVCPDCGNAGTVTTTTVCCRGCGQVIRETTTERKPESPIGHLALSQYVCGPESPMGQVVLSGARARAAADLATREPAWLVDMPDPWDDPPQPALFVPPDSPRVSHHFDVGD